MFFDDRDFLASAARFRLSKAARPAEDLDFASIAQAALAEQHGLSTIAAEAFEAAAGEDNVRVQSLVLPGPVVLLLLWLDVPCVSAIDPEGAPIIRSGGLAAVALTEGVEPAGVEVKWLTLLTPIFHPQVSTLGRVAWLTAPDAWVDLVRGLKDIAAFRSWSSEEGVLNRPAADWASSHRKMLPIV